MILKNLGRIFLIFFFSLSVVFANIEFTQILSQENIYLNDTLKVKLQIVIDKNDSKEIDWIDFQAYKTENFVSKLHKDKMREEVNQKVIYTYEYLLEPKFVGNFRLPRQVVRVSGEAIRKRKKWIDISSNELFVDVYPLVDNLSIKGEFKLDLHYQSAKIKANEPLQIELWIKGKGNFQDLKKFELELRNELVYSDDIILETIFKDTNYEGNGSQRFMILAENNFTIPSFSLKYFNPYSNTVEITKTEPIFIEVLQNVQVEKNSWWLKYIYFIFGCCVTIMVFTGWKFFEKIIFKRKNPLYKKIKKIKNAQELYTVLIQNNRNRRFHDVILYLETHLFLNKHISRKNYNECKKKSLSKLNG